jgi:hypothetical protein
MAGGGAAGAAAGGPPRSLPGWAKAPAFRVTAETPRKNAAKATPRGSMFASSLIYAARLIQRISAGIVSSILVPMRGCDKLAGGQITSILRNRVKPPRPKYFSLP